MGRLGARPFVVGIVLNYKFNKRNLERPLKKTIYNFICIVAVFYSF